jgi:hypothetical protein
VPLVSFSGKVLEQELETDDLTQVSEGPESMLCLSTYDAKYPALEANLVFVANVLDSRAATIS